MGHYDEVEDGFGFREFQAFNPAILANMAARVLSEPNSLWVQVMKGIYFPSIDLLHVSKGESFVGLVQFATRERQPTTSQRVVGGGRSVNQSIHGSLDTPTERTAAQTKGRNRSEWEREGGGLDRPTVQGVEGGCDQSFGSPNRRRGSA